jgi:hypothetical protein
VVRAVLCASRTGYRHSRSVGTTSADDIRPERPRSSSIAPQNPSALRGERVWDWNDLGVRPLKTVVLLRRRRGLWSVGRRRCYQPTDGGRAAATDVSTTTGWVADDQDVRTMAVRGPVWPCAASGGGMGPRMPVSGSPYGWRYQQARKVLLSYRLPCSLRLVCDGAVANSVDHSPPLAMHTHVPGSGCCILRPACTACQKSQGGQVAKLLRQRARTRVPPRPSRVW